MLDFENQWMIQGIVLILLREKKLWENPWQIPTTEKKMITAHAYKAAERKEPFGFIAHTTGFKFPFIIS